MNPSSKNVNQVLAQIESAERPPNHPRNLARQAIAQHRQVRAIDPDYDFSKVPRAARQVIYDMTVKYSARHSLLSRLFRR